MAESPVKRSLRKSILCIQTNSGLTSGPRFTAQPNNGLAPPLSSEDSGFEMVPLGCRKPPTHPPYSGALPCSSEDSGTEVVPCGCRGPPTHPPYPQEPLPPPVDEDEAPSVAPSSTSGADWDVDEEMFSDHAEHVVVPSTHTSANKIPRKSWVLGLMEPGHYATPESLPFVASLLAIGLAPFLRPCVLLSPLRLSR